MEVHSQVYYEYDQHADTRRMLLAVLAGVAVSLSPWLYIAAYLPSTKTCRETLHAVETFLLSVSMVMTKRAADAAGESRPELCKTD